jgi:hypothetical protein
MRSNPPTYSLQNLGIGSLVAGICFVVGTLFVKETNQVDIADASTSVAVAAEAAGKTATASASK